jgi:phosphatidylserine decarboxylase
MSDAAVRTTADLAGPGTFSRRLLGFRLAEEGLRFVIPLALATLLAALLLPGPAWPALLAATFAVAAFFRDPVRIPPADETLIVAPADGRVLQIESGPAGHRIAVFLSVFDVHVNRAVTGGTVQAVDYRPGLFLPAWDKRCTAENEQTVIDLETPRGPVRIVQIAGLIARRIVTYVDPAAPVARGQRIGMIRFGSRTELILPPGAAVRSKVGDYVWGGETAVAQWQP